MNAGSALSINSGARTNYPSVAAFDSTSPVVCFEDDASSDRAPSGWAYGVCSEGGERGALEASKASSKASERSKTVKEKKKSIDEKLFFFTIHAD